jgi:hypothetical protein
MSDQPVRKRWWHRVRFSLRGLIIAVGIVGGGMGWNIHRAQVQRDAVAAIERHGGFVLYDWQWKNGRRVPMARVPWPGWLVDRIGIDYLARVVYVDVRDRASDELLIEVAKLPGLECLLLARSPVTDEGLAHLESLTSLRSLTLDDTGVGDAGLVHLKPFTRLQTLALGLTKVTDAGLVHLKPLKGLKWLSLRLTLISDAAGQALQRALPNTRIAAPGWGMGTNQGRALAIYERMTKTKSDQATDGNRKDDLPR